jgi:hypothetical protein
MDEHLSKSKSKLLKTSSESLHHLERLGGGGLVLILPHLYGLLSVCSQLVGVVQSELKIIKI